MSTRFVEGTAATGRVNIFDILAVATTVRTNLGPILGFTNVVEAGAAGRHGDQFGLSTDFCAEAWGEKSQSVRCLSPERGRVHHSHVR